VAEAIREEEVSRWFDSGRKLPHTTGRERLVDVWTPHWARVWVQLVPDYTDLEREECGEESIGEPTGSFQHERDNEGIRSWLRQPDGGYTNIGRFEWWMSWAHWALQEGIAPRQPFLVHLHEPYYSKSWTDCGYEYDCDCDWYLVRVEHRQPSVALRYWSRWLEGTQKIFAADMKDAEAQEAKVWSDEKALEVHSSWFWSNYYDEMSPPDRLRLTLRSKHSGKFVHGQIASAEASDWAEAYKKLAAEAQKHFPDLTEERLRNMKCNNGW
jgi:hypothetical protein